MNHSTIIHVHSGDRWEAQEFGARPGRIWIGIEGDLSAAIYMPTEVARQLRDALVEILTDEADLHSHCGREVSA